ncbi:hypothetical protein XELAEV_18015384mg, partial [Xenopus laevis]
LKSGLLKNFADVTVIETECPDLSKEPFEFPVYNVNSVARKIGLPGAYILGAGATSHKSLGMNADKKTRLAEQAESAGTVAVNKSYVASVNPGVGSCLLEKYRDRNNDNNFGLLYNLYACEGKTGKSACQLNSDEDVNGWLKFYEMTAPLICQLVFVSHDPGYDLCLEHTHCYSHHVEGGHYHYDTTPNTLEYLGYFHPAEFLYRIDKPSDTHMVGRD